MARARPAFGWRPGARFAGRAGWIALISAAAALSGAASEIKVMTSGAFTAAYQDLFPRFQSATGHTFVTAATSMGVGREAIPFRLKSGEPVDVVIVAAPALDQLVADGLVAAGSRVALATSSIGVAVKSGSPKPDIASAEAFKRALLAARTIAYSASVSGDYFVNELLPRLGIAGQVMPKCTRITQERVGVVVARGEAELGLQQISELLPIPGIELIGPLPPELQKVTVFAAGIPMAARDPVAAKDFLRYLSSPAAADAIRRTGLDPVVPRP